MNINDGNIFNRDNVTDEFRYGLPVIIYARWVLVVAGMAFALWNPGDLVDLQVSVILILGLAIANFFLHVEVTRNRMIDSRIVYAASVLDLTFISVVLAVSGSFPSNIYVFYLPALLSISVTFPTTQTAVYTIGATAVYAVISLGQIAADAPAMTSALTMQVLTHVLVLIAVPACGNVYWRLERSRRNREIRTEQVEQAITESYDFLEREVSQVGVGS